MTYVDHFIGIDGGGTKTECVLTDASGRLLTRCRLGASNPNDVTPEGSASVMAEGISLLTSEASVALPSCSIYGGISGALNHRDTLTRLLREAFPDAGCIRIGSDVTNLLSAELPEGNGACVICGTGSACFLREGETYTRIGGWGYLLDSAGSGYDLGRQALEAVLRAHDGRGEATSLTQLISARLGGGAESRITEIYTGGKPFIASMAPLVFEAADAGDAVAGRILDRNAAAIAEYITTAFRTLASRRDDAPSGDMPMPVILGGSISTHRDPSWRMRIQGLLPPDVNVSLSVASTPVIWGALVQAVKCGGAPASPSYDSLKAAFLADYAKVQEA